jgi:hypothetical protein
MTAQAMQHVLLALRNPCKKQGVASSIPAEATRQLMKQYHVKCALYATSCAPPSPLALLPLLAIVAPYSITDCLHIQK